MKRAIVKLEPYDHTLLVRILQIRARRPIAYRVAENGCWICLSHLSNPSGYPQMGYSGKRVSVPQYMFIRHTGIIPKRGELIRHTCDNSGCINPDHLILGTPKDNYQDYLDRGKSPYNLRRKPRKYLRKRVSVRDYWEKKAGCSMAAAENKQLQVIEITD